MILLKYVNNYNVYCMIATGIQFSNQSSDAFMPHNH